MVPIRVPPLRERREDIPQLVDYFLQRIADSLGQRPEDARAAAMQRLQHHDWPGNVRELRNLIERMMILTRGDRIEAADVPLEAGVGRAAPDDLFHHRTFQAFKDDAERRFIERKLAENDGNISKTARDLEMQRSNFYKKLQKYNLDREEE